MKLLLRIHHFLLPKSHDIGYSAYVILAFLGIFFFNFYFKPAQGAEIWLVIVGLALFLCCYFRAYWCQGKELVFYIMVICLIGSVLAMINFGANVFFVYAAGFCCGFSGRKNAFYALLAVVVYVVIFSYFSNQHVYFWFPAIFFSGIIGLLNIHQVEVQNKNKALKQSQQEIGQLAQTAERERISRDLHDLLGHSLSVITLKAELASKMIDKGIDDEKIRAEIKAVETLSRETLAQVRGAVKGYNIASVNAELLQARVATEAVGIELIENIEPFDYAPEAESELAMIIREAITNVIRHADTRKVWVAIKQQANELVLSIKDQGRITEPKANSGMNNMRSRVDKLGGKMQFNSSPTTELNFIIPTSNLTRLKG